MIEITGIEAAIALIKKKTSVAVREKAMQFAMTEAKNKAVHHYAPEKYGTLKSLIYKRKTGRLEYTLGCDAPWAVFHEYGSYNIPSGEPDKPTRVKSGYSPFLRPALWWVIKKFPDIFKDWFDKE